MCLDVIPWIYYPKSYRIEIRICDSHRIKLHKIALNDSVGYSLFIHSVCLSVSPSLSVSVSVCVCLCCCTKSPWLSFDMYKHSSYIILSLLSSYIILSLLYSSPLVLSHLILPPLVLSHLILSQLISSDLILSHLILSSLI